MKRHTAVILLGAMGIACSQTPSPGRPQPQGPSGTWVNTDASRDYEHDWNDCSVMAFQNQAGLPSDPITQIRAHGANFERCMREDGWRPALGAYVNADPSHNYADDYAECQVTARSQGVVAGNWRDVAHQQANNFEHCLRSHGWKQVYQRPSPSASSRSG